MVSRRAVIESEKQRRTRSAAGKPCRKAWAKGIVKNLTDHGAFADLGGVDGLLHITDMARKRVKHPSEIVNVGDEINVVRWKLTAKIRIPGPETAGRRSGLLSLNVIRRYQTDRSRDQPDRLRLLAEIEEGVEGPVHVSEMDWTNKNIHPSKVVNVGDVVEVMVLGYRRRTSSYLPRVEAVPTRGSSSQNPQMGDRVEGKIKSYH